MAIYCDKCGARHECSVCPACSGFGLSNLQVAAGMGKSFQPTDELRAKFEAWRDSLPAKHWARYDLSACKLGWDAAHASRDAEVEALRKDAERYRKLLDLLDEAESVSNEASTVRNIIDDAINLGSGCMNLHLDAAMREESK